MKMVLVLTPRVRLTFFKAIAALHTIPYYIQYSTYMNTYNNNNNKEIPFSIIFLTP